MAELRRLHKTLDWAVADDLSTALRKISNVNAMRVLGIGPKDLAGIGRKLEDMRSMVNFISNYISWLEDK